MRHLPWRAGRTKRQRGQSVGVDVMKVGILRETAPRERRVGLIPDVVAQLVKSGAEVLVEKDAGRKSFFSDEDYTEAGARVLPSAAEVGAQADVILKVQKPSLEEIDRLREGSTLISLLYAQLHLDLVERLAARKITSFSMEAVPRVTRAQSMDVLSSMSTISGYKAVIRAAMGLSKLMPMLVTAAGTLPPARALILGAGVAGLQAIATARRLGAVVEAFDVRPAAKEQVESLGARFVSPPTLDAGAEDKGGYAKELSKDQQTRNLEVIAERAKEAEIVITTALIPGKPAPILLTEDMVKAMKPGAVIVDLAAEMGGNCELTEPGKEVIHHGVLVIGPLNLPSTAPTHASQMYSRNIFTFYSHLVKDGKVNVDLEDEITGAMCITHEGQVIHEATKRLIESRLSEGGGQSS